MSVTALSAAAEQEISPDLPAYLAGPLADFWGLAPEQRTALLLEAIRETHAWHFTRNPAYRATVSARGVGPHAPDDLARLLRPTAQTFKSYIDLLGSPFPQHEPQRFLGWLADQLSIDLPADRFNQFRPRYGSLEALLVDIERIFSDLGLEVLTSSGTSGRSTILVRDRSGLDRTVESFYLSFQRFFGMQADHRAIFIMPRQSRIAMARMAQFAFKGIGLPAERMHCTIPFPAQPDMVRIRAGRTYQPGLSGWIERRALHPLMGWMNARYVTPRANQATLTLLEQAERAGEKVLLFSGWVQLHALALELQRRGQVIRLAPGSLVGAGGGMKEQYPFSPAQIRRDLATVIQRADHRELPVRDCYGMAEANWAAMQCREGSYHLPPWVYAVTLDEANQVQAQPDATGLLAFFDPFGGGRLFPAFFKTADRVRLVNGAAGYHPELSCACGEAGAYLAPESIRRVDLVDEAGCAAQV